MLSRFRSLSNKVKRLVVAFAVVLGGAGGLVVAGAALPAQAVNCAYGDNFYYFDSDATAHLLTAVNGGSGTYFLQDDGVGSLFCQTAPSGPWAEWVEKGTSLCATYDHADGDKIKLQTCAGLASQYWSLQDNLGGENWGFIENDYLALNVSTSNGMLDFGNGYWIYAQCFNSGGTGGCEPYGYNFQFNLNGPWR